LRNQQFYKARKAEYERLKEETARRVANNEMTQSEADAQLDKAAPGWYRTIRELQRKINATSSGSEQYASLRQQLNDVMQQNAEMAHQFQIQCQFIYDLHCPESSDTVASITDIPSFPPTALLWPTEVSIEAYLRIIALIFPMSYWSQIIQPHSKTIRDCALDLLHPDHSNKFDAYMDQEDKASVTSVFIASAKLVDQYMQQWSANEIKMAEWNQSWLQIQRDIQQAYLPQSGTAPTFVAGLIFADAKGMIENLRRRSQQNNDTPDPSC
jgi:hypothetical protein